MTFDDGPGEKLTPQILTMLAEHNAKATFFLLGRNIEGREHIVRRIAEEGHEICSHGYDHVHHWKVSPWRAIRDTQRGWRTIDAALGRENGVYPFRPPHGKLNLASLLFLLIRRVPVVYWSIVSGDTYRAQDRDVRMAADALRTSRGGVVLAHDFNRSDAETERFVLDSLSAALATAREEGIPSMTVSEFSRHQRLRGPR